MRKKNLLVEMRKIRWRRIAMIFQAAMNALNPVHRVDDQIAEAILAHDPSVGKAEAKNRVRGLFQLVGIPENRMEDYPHQYSGGMKQRAIIAMALACRPKLIIADEPTTALDVIVQDQILEETRDLQKEFNISIIFISHDISIVADVCHDIGIMYAGQLVEYGPREEVFQNPCHPYTKALLSSYPTLTGIKTTLYQAHSCLLERVYYPLLSQSVYSIAMLNTNWTAPPPLNFAANKIRGRF